MFLWQWRGALVPGAELAGCRRVPARTRTATVNGGIDFGSDFPNGQRADVATGEAIVEVGAFAGFTELGGGEFLLVSVPFEALASGVADFVADTTDLGTGEDTLLFGLDTSVPLAQVRCVNATLEITPTGEGEASDLSAFAAAVNRIFSDETDWLLP